MTRVIAIDPGKMTGIAFFEMTPVDLLLLETRELEYGEPVWSTLRGAGVTYNEAVCESFIINGGTAKKSFQPYSMYLIGATQMLCANHDVPFTLQTPAKAKAFATDERLKSVGLYDRHSGGHARDATRHGLVYFVEKHGATALKNIREAHDASMNTLL